MTNRRDYLNGFTLRQLRIYGRRQGVSFLMSWTKAQVIGAIISAGK